MMIQVKIKIPEGDALAGVRGFLAQLFERDVIDALYVPIQDDQGIVMPALVTDPALLEGADPLAPVMPINSARAVSVLTRGRSEARLGAVLRPCEIRALIELVKLQQASLEGLTLIGIDCPGTFEGVDYIKRWKEQGFNLQDYLSAAEAGRDPEIEELPLRTACRICNQPAPGETDIHLEWFGADLDTGIPVVLTDKIAAALEMNESGDDYEERRQAVLRPLVSRREQARQEELLAMRNEMSRNGGLPALFAACIRCHNCMTACPICYCKTCLFKTAAFDHPPEHYLNAARHKGALRMLGDTLLFHMTRLSHMSTSCVSCGMCTSACPAGIPVGTIFSAVGAQVQQAFDYLPGSDLADPLPLVTFQVQEWTEIGE